MILADLRRVEGHLDSLILMGGFTGHCRRWVKSLAILNDR
jgi:hypothetical protein